MPSFIASAEAHDISGGTSTTHAVGSSLTVAVGDVVHVHLGFERTSVSGTTVTVADGLGNTYTQRQRVNHSTQTDMAHASFECIVTNAGTATPTATYTNAVSYRHIRALQGRPDSGKEFQADASTSGQSVGASTAVAATAFTAAGPGFLSAGVKNYSVANWTSSWGTLVDDISLIDHAAAYKLTTTSATETPAFTSSNGDTWATTAIHTKEVTSGGSTTIPPGILVPRQFGFRAGR